MSGRSPKLTVCSQLQRGKDPNKSSKKNKDSKDGTSSPNSTSTTRDPNQSPVLTPSSSSSTLNDIRNKPLPPSNSGLGSELSGAPGAGQPGQLGPLGSSQNPGVPDRFSSMTSANTPANGGSAAGRLGSLTPTVIISPSAPVRPMRQLSAPRTQPLLLTSFNPATRTAAWRRRDHAPRPGAAKGRSEVAHVRSSTPDAERRAGGHSYPKEAAVIEAI